MSNKFTHLNDHGDAHMVDVAEKLATGRMAVAKAVVVMEPATLQAIKTSELKKAMFWQLRGLRASWRPKNVVI
jgi:Molybdenum cofactor biosynthesis enzyme